MMRIALFLGFLVAIAGPASGQVQVTQLAAPDAFSTPGRDTGLPADLWRGTPAEMALAVLPLLATRPMSPAASHLARQLLATGAPGPEGSTGDDGLAAGRANAMIALGDLEAAARILERAPSLDRNAGLSKAAAEVALLSGDATRACAIAAALAAGRGDIYWLRLRSFCQAEAGQSDQAHLTFELAQTQARDAVYGRLMSARLNATPPGPASLRNGLDLSLSRSLKLDVAAAKPAPAVAVALSGQAPPAPSYDLAGIDEATAALAEALTQGPPSEAGVSALIGAAMDADLKIRPKRQGSALLMAALLDELSSVDRTRLASFAVPEGRSPTGRNVALEAAAQGRRMGETALLALWICAEAGPSGLTVADRARIIRSLRQVKLDEPARLFALEGLAGLK
jgi:hypothetical protein